MKYKELIIIAIAAFTMSLGSCKKKEVTTIITHKGVVLYNVCGNVVIQSVGPDYFGENNWVDENNPSKPTYDHVFTVGNECDFGNYSAGDTITYAFAPANIQDCVRCLLYVATPATSYNIQVIK